MSLSKLALTFAIAWFFAVNATMGRHPADSGSHRTTGVTERTGPHQGTMHDVGNVRTETVVHAKGVQVYVYSEDGALIPAGSGRGVATVSLEGTAKRYRYHLVPAVDHSFKADMNLSQSAGLQIAVDVQLVGIPNVGAAKIAYREVTSVPATSRKLKVEIVQATRADAPLIKRQAKCPVMDEPLGSMGDPIKLLVGGKPVFLCCKGCIKRVQAEPDKYLAMIYPKSDTATVAAGTESVRPGVFKVTAADAPFVAAQKICPVMDEPLDAMGGPFKVNAAGKAIYICCPGCAKKIAGDPEKYIAVLAEQGVQAPRIR